MSHPSRAFTLVELLVVVIIIAVMVALLLPAIQASREAARCAACLSNLKQLALATQHFHQAQEHLPNYWWQHNAAAGACPANQVEGGWLMWLLPYLEQTPAFADIKASPAMGASSTSVLVQAASANYQPAQPAVILTPAVYGPLPPQVWIPGTGQSTTQTGSTTSQVGHTYTPINTTISTGYWYQPPAPLITPAVVLTPAVPAVGTPAVYQQVYTYTGVLRHAGMLLSVAGCPSDSLSRKDESVLAPNPAAPSGSQKIFALTNYQANTQAFISKATGVFLPGSNPYLQCSPASFSDISDGLSNTILFAEGARYCDGSYRMAFWNSYQYQQSHNFGKDWNGIDNTFMFQSISDPTKCDNWRVQGFHGGSLNVALADGSARSILPLISHRETTNPNNPKLGVNPVMGSANGVWDDLILPRDGESIASF